MGRRRCGRADGFRSLPQPVAAGCGGAGRAGARTPARHHLLPKHRPVAAAVPLSNLRLAPLQLAAAGHPATTHAPSIDAMLVEEDTLGDAACFSERVVTLPRDCVVHVPPPGFQARPASPAWRAAPGPGTPLRVAVCATSLKLNARFLAMPAYRRARVQGRAIPFLFVGDCRGVARGPAAHGDRRRAASPRTKACPTRTISRACAAAICSSIPFLRQHQASSTPSARACPGSA